ncbi:MAG: class I SAM-dependent methyltransferase [Deltaproteobacteria bacterium]|nr:class I SAM-dependent methyltransferase [Deltaproteobacteria bacterium]
MQKAYYKDYYQWSENHWWFLARQSIVLRLLGLCPGTNKNMVVLNIGCADSMKKISQALAPEHWVHLDIHHQTVRHALGHHPNSIGIQADCHQLPFKDSSFDIIFLLDVLEHLEDDENVLENLFRICKQGGKIFLTAPAYSWLWGRQDIISNHFRRYTKKGLKTLISKTSFHLEKISYFNFFLFPLIAFYRLILRFYSSVHKIVEFAPRMNGTNNPGGVSPRGSPIPKTCIQENRLRRSVVVYSSKTVISDFSINNRFLNIIFFYLFQTEKYFLKKLNFPCGVSLMCLCKKK